MSNRWGLTAREVQVLQAITDGNSTEEVAELLGVSVKTLKNHLSRVFVRMEARNRTEAVVMALREGLTSL